MYEHTLGALPWVRALGVWVGKLGNVKASAEAPVGARDHNGSDILPHVRLSEPGKEGLQHCSSMQVSVDWTWDTQSRHRQPDRELQERMPVPLALLPAVRPEPCREEARLLGQGSDPVTVHTTSRPAQLCQLPSGDKLSTPRPYWKGRRSGLPAKSTGKDTADLSLLS